MPPVSESCTWEAPPSSDREPAEEETVMGNRSRRPNGDHSRFSGVIGPKWLAAPAIVAVAAWSVLAGGGDKPCRVDVSRPTGQICRTAPGPVNVEVRIDATMFRGDLRVAQGAAAAAARATEMPIEYGGTVQISAFGRAASRPRILFEATVPTRAELRLSQRGGLQDDLRAKVKFALSKLTAADLGGSFAAGSDILGAETLASTASLKSGLPLVRVVLTDGRVQMPGFTLVSVLRHLGEAAALRELRTHLPQARGP
jgi:hypothetical protein